MRFDLHIFDSVESTNAMVKAALAEGASEGYAVAAYRQRAGYGRRGHAWVSPEGGLYLSLALRPNVEPAELTNVTSVAAVALRRACVALGRADVRIKQPNDLVVPDADAPGGVRKLAGILAETAGDGVTLGFGVNVVRFPVTPLEADGTRLAFVHEGECATSGRAAVDRVRDIVCNAFDQVYAQWQDKGFAALEGEYRAGLLPGSSGEE